MDTVKASVRVIVLMFVVVGAIISLAGTDSGLVKRDQSTADQAEETNYIKPSTELVTVELGSTG